MTENRRKEIADRISRFRHEKMEENLRKIVPETRLGELYLKAYSKYGAICLWNCLPDPSIEGMKIVAERLRKYGDLRAWYLADEIKTEIKNLERDLSSTMKI